MQFFHHKSKKKTVAKKNPKTPNDNNRTGTLYQFIAKEPRNNPKPRKTFTELLPVMFPMEASA